MIIKSGKPSAIVSGTPELGQNVTETSPNDVAVTTLIGNILSQFTDGAVIVVDPHTGKVYAASAVAKRDALLAAIEDDGDVATFAPDASQTGRSLSFNKVAGESSLALPAEAELTTAVKPKFTVESLASKLLQKMQDAETVTPALAGKQFLIIDQVNKRVKVGHVAIPPDARAALDAVVLNAGEAVKVTLTPDAADAPTVSLPFEGGAV